MRQKTAELSNRRKAGDTDDLMDTKGTDYKALTGLWLIPCSLQIFLGGVSHGVQYKVRWGLAEI